MNDLFLKYSYIILILLVLPFKGYAQNPSIDLVPERLFTSSYEDGENHISDFTNKNYRKGNIKKAFKIIDCLVRKDTVILFNFGKDGWRTSKTEIYCLNREKTSWEILRIEFKNDCFKIWEKISFSDSFGNSHSGGNIYEFNKQGYVIRNLVYDSASKDTDMTKFGYDKYNRIRYRIENNQTEPIFDGSRHLIGLKKTEGDTQINSKKFHYELINDTLFVYSGFSNERGTSVHPWNFYCYNKEGKFVRREYTYPEYIIFKTTKTKRTLRHWRRKKIEHYKFSGKYLIGKIIDTTDPEMKFIYY